MAPWHNMKYTILIFAQKWIINLQYFLAGNTCGNILLKRQAKFNIGAQHYGNSTRLRMTCISNWYIDTSSALSVPLKMSSAHFCSAEILNTQIGIKIPPPTTNFLIYYLSKSICKLSISGRRFKSEWIRSTLQKLLYTC